MTVYNKLVRDKIPKYIQSKGGTPKFHVADETEYRIKLFEKLIEETKEFKEAGSLEECADVLEVLDVLITFLHFDQKELQSVRLKKRDERGGFQKRIILEES